MQALEAKAGLDAAAMSSGEAETEAEVPSEGLGVPNLS